MLWNGSEQQVKQSDNIVFEGGPFMNRIQQIQYLIQVLLQEMPACQEQARAFPQDELSQRRLLRSLMNVRRPMPLDP